MLLTCAQRTSVRMRLKSSLEQENSPTASEAECTTTPSSDSTTGQALARRRCALHLKVAAAVVEELGEPLLLTLACQGVLPVGVTAAAGTAVHGSVGVQEFRGGDSYHGASGSRSRGFAG